MKCSGLIWRVVSRSNSFQEYGRRERKEDEGSMEDAADKQYACLPACLSWCRVVGRVAGLARSPRLTAASGLSGGLESRHMTSRGV